MDYIVICREDSVDGRPGEYTLATRRIFSSKVEAIDYAWSINASRYPLVVSGRFVSLRQDAVYGNAMSELERMTE
jgi:hypothetical protein